jgi:LmbE family N-acetylglucosaminyl deacetylase
MVVFAPHPNDETLACGGTIIKRLREGFNVYIILMTD